MNDEKKLLPTALVRVKDFVTYKVYNADSHGQWQPDERASGDDLGDMITVWQQKTRAKIHKTEAPRVSPHREGDARYRVAMSTFVYYTPAVEGARDAERRTNPGPKVSGLAIQPDP
jgi:hypothetical protein